MVIGGSRLTPGVWIVGRLILERAERNGSVHSVDFDLARGRAIGTGEETKVVVKGVVFLDDKDDMLNGHGCALCSRPLQSSKGRGPSPLQPKGKQRPTLTSLVENSIRDCGGPPEVPLQRSILVAEEGLSCL